ncbi:MAG TPA: DUF308 domain-containing protein [Gemmatimonadaceae bacterium]|nr:DUF308 domain-containing protein [Gemmatimonadaceae bacterium]
MATRASDQLRSAYQRAWWSLVLRGLLGIAVGVIILWRPLDSIAAFALVIAIWALISGIVQIVHAFDLRGLFSQWWAMLISGIVGVGFGVAALYYYPSLSLTFAVAWTIWWLLFTGGVAIYIAFQERRYGLPWGWTMTFGAVSVAAAVLAAVYPGVTLATIMGLVAGYSIVAGIVLLVGAYKLSAAKDAIAAGFHSARPV